MAHYHIRNQTAAAIASSSDHDIRPVPGPSRTTASDCRARVHRRVFIGPYPVAIAAPQLKRTRNVIQRLSREGSSSSIRSGDITDESLWRFVKEYVRRSETSRWDTELDPSLREELVNRLKTSAWLPNAKQRQETEWIGDTFEIGTDLLGAAFVVEDASSRAASSPGTSSKGKAPLSRAPASPPTMNGSTSYVTAASGPSQITENPVQVGPSDNFSTRDYLSVPLPETQTSSDVESQQAKSDTFLLPPTQDGSSQTRPLSYSATARDSGTATTSRVGAIRTALRPAGTIASGRPGNRTLSVNFADLEISESEQDPAHPREVLARTNTQGQLERTSAGAAVETQDALSPEQAIMTDRMLVHVSYTRTGGLSSQFDEDDARKHPELEEREWGEYIVTWKGQILELYEDHGAFGKDWVLGNKRLAHVILLDGSRTPVSVFSYVDMSFCVISPPVEGAGSSRQPRFHRSDPGTNVFIFKCKTRSRAIDWIWKLRMQLGTTIPPSIDIHVPVLDTRVTFNIPDNYTTLTVERIIHSCRGALSSVPEYRSITAEIDRGAVVALAWRREMKLDWVWLANDITNAPRDWSVLFGLALQGRIPLQLELRLARHSLTKAKLGDGTDIEEPEAIEGYLYRLKPKSQTRTNVYISSHDGRLFVTQSARAFPPPIPQARIALGDAEVDSIPPCARSQADEKRRISSQILNASGCVDLRDILIVRRVSLASHAGTSPKSQTTAPSTHDRMGDNVVSPLGEVGPEDSEMEEPGGATHLLSHKNPHRLRQKRILEVTLRTGVTVRFEAHSVANAIEWVTRLNALVKYWCRRHIVDARVETDIVHFSGKQHSMTLRPRDGAGRKPVLPNPEAGTSSMSLFWSWCVLDNCRPIIKAGQLYTKSEPRKHYKHTFMVLIAGHLVLFHITKTPYALQPASRAVNLSAAFVYSGVLAAQHLPVLFNPEILPRRYQDGLETDDSDLASTLVIRYRKQPLGWQEKSTEFPLTPLTSKKTPRTNSKYKLLILKARSQLERDAWCWALNTEMERIIRASAEKEEQLRAGI